MSLPLLVPGSTGVAAPLTFRSPHRTVTATGPVTDLLPGRGDDPAAATRIVDALVPGQVAVGRLPFEPDGPMVFHPVTSDPVTPTSAREPENPSGPPSPRRPVPLADPRAFRDAVDSALRRLRDDTDPLQKVVLGRWLDLPWPADPAATVAGLLATGAPYVFRLPGPGDSDLVGASPELLVRRHGRDVLSHPLAGSLPRSDDPAEDAAQAAQLLESAKDLAEHEYVVRDITDRLRPWCTELDVPGRPTLLSTDSLWHLGTPLRGRLVDRPPTALHLAQLLHPTPAVAGYPRATALAAIDDLEDRPRGVMTGAVGWVDGAGDGEFAVTIRSALVHPDRVELFAGAGIVADSLPEAEVAETAAKFRTVLQALVAR